MTKLIRINPRDNVAVALHPVAAGETLLVGGGAVTAAEEIPQGHKIALAAIAEGQPVVKYGYPIGHATADIAAGAWVHTHNMRTNLSGEEEYSYEPAIPAVESVEPETFMGFRRKDGRVAAKTDASPCATKYG